jgi:hypothetical protein
MKKISTNQSIKLLYPCKADSTARTAGIMKKGLGQMDKPAEGVENE